MLRIPVSHQARLVLLDGKGKQMSSEELAQFLGGHQDRNPAPLLFAVGPANGFSEEARQAGVAGAVTGPNDDGA